MTSQQCAERQAARDNLVRELVEALENLLDVNQEPIGNGWYELILHSDDLQPAQEILNRAKEQQGE